jgi:hypothetical protein
MRGYVRIVDTMKNVHIVILLSPITRLGDENSCVISVDLKTQFLSSVPTVVDHIFISYELVFSELNQISEIFFLNQPFSVSILTIMKKYIPSKNR